MSTRVIAYCWPIKIPATAKAVLISLADQANDDGECWPSVDTISERTCLDDRTIQRAIVWLEQGGYVSRKMRSGRSTRYVVNLRQSDTPVAATPPSESHPTPVTAPPHPRHSATHNRKGTIKEPSIKQSAVLAVPDWVPAKEWADWNSYRGARKGWTARARELSLATLDALRDAGHDPVAVINQSIERGWSGLFPIAGTHAHARLPPPAQSKAAAWVASLREPDSHAFDLETINAPASPRRLGA
jgi:hypothetical protein